MPEPFIQQEWSTVITVILSTIATYWVMIGSFAGMMRHRIARVTLGIGFLTVTIGFALSLFLEYNDAAVISRVGYWVLCIGGAWSATSGIKAGKQMKEDTERIDRIETVINTLNTGGRGGAGGKGGKGGASATGEEGGEGEPGKLGEWSGRGGAGGAGGTGAAIAGEQGEQGDPGRDS